MAGEDMGTDFVLSGRDTLSPILKRLSRDAAALDRQLESVGNTSQKAFSKVSVATKKGLQNVEAETPANTIAKVRRKLQRQVKTKTESVTVPVEVAYREKRLTGARKMAAAPGGKAAKVTRPETPESIPLQLEAPTVTEAAPRRMVRPTTPLPEEAPTVTEAVPRRMARPTTPLPEEAPTVTEAVPKDTVRMARTMVDAGKAAQLTNNTTNLVRQQQVMDDIATSLQSLSTIAATSTARMDELSDSVRTVETNLEGTNAQVGDLAQMAALLTEVSEVSQRLDSPGAGRGWLGWTSSGLSAIAATVAAYRTARPYLPKRLTRTIEHPVSAFGMGTDEIVEVGRAVVTTTAASGGLLVAAIDLEEELYPLTRELKMSDNHLRQMKDSMITAAVATGTSTDAIAEMAHILAAGNLDPIQIGYLSGTLAKLSAIFPGMNEDVATLVYGLTAFSSGSADAAENARVLETASATLMVGINKVAEISGSSRQRVVQLAKDVEDTLRPSFVKMGLSAKAAASQMVGVLSVAGFLDSQFIDGAKALELYDKMLNASISPLAAAENGMFRLYGMLGLNKKAMDELAKTDAAGALQAVFDQVYQQARSGMDPFLMERLYGEQMGMAAKDFAVLAGLQGQAYAKMAENWAKTQREMSDQRALDRAWQRTTQTTRQSLIRIKNVFLTFAKSLGTPLVNIINTLVLRPLLGVTRVVGLMFGNLNEGTRSLITTFTMVSLVATGFAIALSRLSFVVRTGWRGILFFNTLTESIRQMFQSVTRFRASTFAEQLGVMGRAAWKTVGFFGGWIRSSFRIVAVLTLVIEAVGWFNRRLDDLNTMIDASREKGGMLAAIADAVTWSLEKMGNMAAYILRPFGRVLQVLGLFAGAEVLFSGAAWAVQRFGIALAISLGPLLRLSVIMAGIEFAVGMVADGLAYVMKIFGFSDKAADRFSSTIKMLMGYFTIGYIVVQSFGGITAMVGRLMTWYNSLFVEGSALKGTEIAQTVTLTGAREAEAAATNRAAAAQQNFNQAIRQGTAGPQANGTGTYNPKTERYKYNKTSPEAASPPLRQTGGKSMVVVPSGGPGMASMSRGAGFKQAWGQGGGLIGGVTATIGVTTLAASSIYVLSRTMDTNRKGTTLLGRAWEALSENVWSVLGGLISLASGWPMLQSMFTYLTGAGLTLTGIWGGLTGVLGGLASGIGVLAAGMFTLAGGVAALALADLGGIIWSVKILKDTAKLRKSTLESEEYLAKVREGGVKTLDDQNMANVKQINHWKMLNGQLRTGKITQEEYQAAVGQLTTQVFGAEEAMRKLRRAEMLNAQGIQSGMIPENIEKSWKENRGLGDEAAAGVYGKEWIAAANKVAVEEQTITGAGPYAGLEAEMPEAGTVPRGAYTPEEIRSMAPADILALAQSAAASPEAGPPPAGAAPVVPGPAVAAVAGPVMAAPPVMTPVATPPGSTGGDPKKTIVEALTEFFPLTQERLRREQAEFAQMEAVRKALEALQTLAELHPIGTLLGANMLLEGGGL